LIVSLGGCVPLGYDVVERKLIPNDTEAATVRHIFQRYLEVGTVPGLLVDLRAAGIVTKAQTRRDGGVRGGGPFSRGALHHLLKNRIYRGAIVHHAKHYPGEHDAIVSAALFDAVKDQLAANIGDRRSGVFFRSPSLLAGMIRDGADRPMSPSHTLKSGKRYRYYVSNNAVELEQPQPAMRLPAKALEASVLAAFLRTANDTPALIASASSISAEQIARFRAGQHRVTQEIESARTSSLRPLLLNLDVQVTVEADRIIASCCRQRLIQTLDPQASWNDAAQRLAFEVPATVQRRGQERKLRLDPVGDRSARDPRLVGLIIRAQAAREQLMRSDRLTLSPARRELNRVARASYLAPDIVAAIFEGRQPVSLRARTLERIGVMPLCWKAQREMLGFN
jgi:site-specific DNA recombinase